MRRGATCLVLASLGLVGCSPGAFSDLENGASTVALSRPSGLPQAGKLYGSAMSSFVAQLGSRTVSRLVVSSGERSAFAVYAGWDEELLLGPPLYDGCRDIASCGERTGAAVIGMQSWRGDQACVLVTSPGSNRARIECETSGDMFEVVEGGAMSEMGASAAAMPPGSPVGVAFLGAPAGAGDVYRLPDGSNPVPLTLASLASIPAGGRLGAVVAAAPLGADVLLVATAPEINRVVMARVAFDGSSHVVTVLGCVNGPDGFGGALVAGDVVGDETPEVFIGGHGQVDMFSLASLDPMSCMPGSTITTAPARTLTCPSGTQVPCDASQFGASAALGDIDGDGDQDLIAGAPGATVDSKVGAGAVYVLPNDGSGPNMAGAVAVFHSDPGANDGLGTKVAALRTQIGMGERDEVVASAPLGNAVYVFLCTGLPGDATVNGGDRCLGL